MQTQGLLDFCNALEETSLSIWIKDNSEWFVPSVQVVHIIFIAAILVSFFILNFKIMKAPIGDNSLRFDLKRLSSIISGAFFVLLITGLLMIVAEPARSLGSPAFQIKVVLLILTLLIFLLFKYTLNNDYHYWQRTPKLKMLSRLSIAVSTLLLMGIVFAGRWIAYF